MYHYSTCPSSCSLCRYGAEVYVARTRRGQRMAQRPNWKGWASNNWGFLRLLKSSFWLFDIRIWSWYWYLISEMTEENGPPLRFCFSVFGSRCGCFSTFCGFSGFLCLVWFLLQFILALLAGLSGPHAVLSWTCFISQMMLFTEKKEAWEDTTS